MPSISLNNFKISSEKKLGMLGFKPRQLNWKQVCYPLCYATQFRHYFRRYRNGTPWSGNLPFSFLFLFCQNVERSTWDIFHSRGKPVQTGLKPKNSDHVKCFFVVVVKIVDVTFWKINNNINKTCLRKVQTHACAEAPVTSVY